MYDRYGRKYLRFICASNLSFRILLKKYVDNYYYINKSSLSIPYSGKFHWRKPIFLPAHLFSLFPPINEIKTKHSPNLVKSIKQTKSGND